MAHPRTTTIVKQFSFSKTLYDMAQRKAGRLGLSTPEYIRHLIVQDNEPRKEFISPAVEQRYWNDYLEFLEEQKVSPTPGATTIEELMRQLEGV